MPLVCRRVTFFCRPPETNKQQFADHQVGCAAVWRKPATQFGNSWRDKVNLRATQVDHLELREKVSERSALLWRREATDDNGAGVARTKHNKPQIVRLINLMFSPPRRERPERL